MGAAVDLKTGRVTWVPDTLCCWWEPDDDAANEVEPMEFRLDSRLIIFHGMFGENEA